MITEAMPINARVMRPDHVAERFVAPDFFDVVASRNHVILLGPRGSGKTTLLTMLTQPALRAWNASHDEPLIEVDYIGVLVRADLTWSRQLRRLGQTVDPTLREEVLQAAYVNHALIATVRYVRDYLRHVIPTEASTPAYVGNHEASLIRQIAPSWGLDQAALPPALSLLKQWLSGRATKLWEELRVAPQLRGSTLRSVSSVDLFSAVAALADGLEEEGFQSSIALLSDELELLPEAVRRYLRSGLRDADERMLIKMSVSPVEPALRNLFANGPEAEAGHDFKVVDLTYPQKTAGYSFTSKLLLDLASRSGLVAENIGELLGRSHFDLPHGRRSELGPYQPRGDLVAVIRSLREFDSSFNEYLTALGVDLDELAEMNEIERASAIRKIRDMALIRNRYLRESQISSEELERGDRGLSRRGFQSYDFFTGRDSVLALLEGNPRWAVNFMASAAQDAAVGSRSLNRSRQAGALADLSARVRSRIQNLPVSPDAEVEVDPTRGRRVLLLLRQLGEHFRGSVLNERFTSDPVTTFVLDEKVSPELAELVGDAVSQGALIHVPRRDEVGVLVSMAGQRFRLAYLLAAQYQLPPILGRAVGMSRIFVSQGQDEIDDSRIEVAELKLFS
jgi:hypothetical protein